jgi:hypothetical protein
MRRVTLYVPIALWQRFRIACLRRNISASQAVQELVEQILETWGE